MREIFFFAVGSPARKYGVLGSVYMFYLREWQKAKETEMDEFMNNDKNSYMVGTCTEMCPKKEMLLREKEHLLHKFEIRSGTGDGNMPKADPAKAIKCYRRSGAGRKISSSDLRPFPILMKTIKYLYHDIFPVHKNEPVMVYDFMFDRLRSVRQDMVIQNLTPSERIRILEPIARFHIYFGYVLSDEMDANFDAFINSTHLQECLKCLLVNYDECERDYEEDSLNSNENHFRNRCDIEGAYLLFNLSHIEALTRGAKLVDKFLNRELLKLSFAWYLKNYVRVFKSIKDLSPLMLCVISSHVPEMRKYALQTMSHGFSCSNSLYPVSHLKELLLYEDTMQVMEDCCHFNVKITGENVNFLKKDFNTSAKCVKLKRLPWVDRVLANYDMVELLCYGSG